MAKTWSDFEKSLTSTLLELSKKMKQSQKETENIINQLKQIQKDKKKLK